MAEEKTAKTTIKCVAEDCEADAAVRAGDDAVCTDHVDWAISKSPRAWTPIAGAPDATEVMKRIARRLG